MRDVRIENVDLRGLGLAGTVIGPVRRVLRRLLRPIFSRQSEINADLASRFPLVESRFQAVESRLPLVESRFQVVESRCQVVESRCQVVESRCQDVESRCQDVESRCQLAERETGNLGHRTVLLNQKLDLLNQKLEGTLAQFEALRQRFDELAEEVATALAIELDHTALTRRLARIEDRLIAAAGDAARPDDAEGDTAQEPLPFPGLEKRRASG